MRLNHLYSRSKIDLINEEYQLPLDPVRYPPISNHVLADFKPSADLDYEILKLDDMARADPLGAYHELKKLFNLDISTGLDNRSSYHDYIKRYERRPKMVVIADLDNFKYLNEKSGLGTDGTNAILAHLGKLIKQNFGHHKCYRKGGDSFAIVADLAKMDVGQAREVLLDLVNKCITTSNQLASCGFHHKDWSEQRRVQPTVSFGISNTDEAANGLLTHIKLGDKGQKPVKYMVVLDSDLRNRLGLSVDDLNKHKQYAFKPASGMTVYESVDGNQPGIVMLECSWSGTPRNRSSEVYRMNEEKNSYLEQPGGAVRIDDKHCVYSPLKESYTRPS